MSYFEDYIEPYIGYEPDSSDYDTRMYAYDKIEKETEKAYLINFLGKQAWVPKSKIDDIDTEHIWIDKNIKLNYINEVKTIKLGDIE